MKKKARVKEIKERKINRKTTRNTNKKNGNKRI